MKGEIWKPVVGFEGFYEVSDRGRVRSLDRVDSAGRSRKGRVLKPTTTKSRRYLSVWLYGNNARCCRSVHIIVAEAFLGPRPKGMHVAHGPTGRSDNCVSNLRYATPSENTLDKHRDGTMPIGSKHHKAKLTESDVRAIRTSRDTTEVLSKRHGVCTSQINRIKARKFWQHI